MDMIMRRRPITHTVDIASLKEWMYSTKFLRQKRRLKSLGAKIGHSILCIEDSDELQILGPCIPWSQNSCHHLLKELIQAR